MLDNPEISDYQYDCLMRELLAIEAQFPQLVSSDSPSQRVGGEPLKEFASFALRLALIAALRLQKDAVACSQACL